MILSSRCSCRTTHEATFPELDPSNLLSGEPVTAYVPGVSVNSNKSQAENAKIIRNIYMMSEACKRKLNRCLKSQWRKQGALGGLLVNLSEKHHLTADKERKSNFQSSPQAVYFDWTPILIVARVLDKLKIRGNLQV